MGKVMISRGPLPCFGVFTSQTRAVPSPLAAMTSSPSVTELRPACRSVEGSENLHGRRNDVVKTHPTVITATHHNVIAGVELDRGDYVRSDGLLK
jgi:hypothetical protein